MNWNKYGDCDGQLNLFDFIAPTTKRFPSIIQELSDEVKAILVNGDNPGYTDDKDKYYIWEHVPNLGYRYELFINVKIDPDYDKKVDALEELKAKYIKEQLEVSIHCSPSLFNDGYINLFVSSLWKDKKRAKNG